MPFLAKCLAKWKMKSQLCDTNQEGRSNFLESIPWKRIVDNQVCSAAKS